MSRISQHDCLNATQVYGKNMKLFSRNIPEHSSGQNSNVFHVAIGIVVVVSVITLPIVLLIYNWASPEVWFPALFVILVLGSVNWSSEATDRKLATYFDERLDDSICTFSRAFDRRKVDPWIIRAV